MPGPMHRMPKERSSIIEWLQDNPMAAFIGMGAVAIVVGLIAYKYRTNDVTGISTIIRFDLAGVGIGRFC